MADDRSRRPGRVSTLKPVRKVSAATAAAAATSIAFALLGSAGVHVPAHVQVEATTLAVYAAGWLRRP